MPDTNKTLEVLKEIIEQHETRFDLNDGLELPVWAADMIRNEIYLIEEAEKLDQWKD